MDPFKYAHAHNDIVWMSQNTNHLPTSPAIDKAMTQAIKKQLYRLYPLANGLEELNQAVLEELNLPHHQAVFAHGASEALYCFLRFLLKPGDNMITHDPSYFAIHHFAELTGATVSNLPIYEAPYRYTLDQLKAAISPNTKAILLIDPINPMGSGYPAEEVEAIAQLAKSHELWLIHDITYRDFYPGHTLATDFYPERTVIAYSLSKTAGLAGLRMGALVARPEHVAAIKPFWVSGLGVNILGQEAALACLQTKSKWLPGMRKTLLANQAEIKKAVDKIEGAFLPVYPSVANMMIIDITRTGLSPEEIEGRMLYDHHVFVRGGSYVSPHFGQHFIRISFSVPPEDIERFCKAFVTVMQKLQAKVK